MNFARLKDRQRKEREGWPETLGLRVHRALSWLDRAEQLGAQSDSDGQFVLLWIAFNAAYATDIDEKYREREQQTFRGSSRSSLSSMWRRSVSSSSCG